MNDKQGYELMKAIFADSGIRYEEGVPDDEIGYWAVEGTIERRLPDNFLKGFNREGGVSHV